MTNDKRLREAYQRLFPTLQRAREEARAALVSILGGLEDGQLVRAYLASSRTKSSESVAAKLERKDAGHDEMLDAVRDLIGMRTVCNNVEDVYRILDAIAAAERFEITSVEDYIKDPQPSGYRAIHINTWFTPSGSQEGIPCEIQVRTLAQDTWSHLTHHDIYKRDAPSELQSYALELSSLLADVDEAASHLRDEARRPAAADAPPALTGIESLGAISLVFQRAFSRSAPDYLVRSAVDWAREYGLKRLDALDSLLQSIDFISEISEEYQGSAGWEPTDEQVFEIGIAAAAKGPAEAQRVAAARGAAERREIESIWRREVLSELPSTFDELVEWAAGDPESGSLGLSEDLFDALGALGECALCGVGIIDELAFVEAVVEHYGLEKDPDGRLSEALMSAGYETGDWEIPSLCGYHGYQMSRD